MEIGASAEMIARMPHSAGLIMEQWVLLTDNYMSSMKEQKMTMEMPMKTRGRLCQEPLFC